MLHKKFMQRQQSSIIVEIPIKHSNNIRLFIKREDLLHPIISGNKYRKLKYNLAKAKRLNYNTLLSFGGAYSNHIAALAYAGKLHGFNTIGVIRGEELEDKIKTNPTLSFAKSCGMVLHFMDRNSYRNKTSPAFVNALKIQFGDFYILPEGGTNLLAVKGCEEILDKKCKVFDYICTSVGTGGTIAGLVNTSEKHQTVLGFLALKNAEINNSVTAFTNKENWRLMHHYHFGGYAKINKTLIEFINSFYKQFQIKLDPVYVGKLMYGIFDLLNNDYFKPHSKILAVHTGGLQGIAGMNLKLKQKQLPLLEV